MTTVVNRNSSLNAAKAANIDEYYTQEADIEREINVYLDYDSDASRGKVILLPCEARERPSCP